MGETNPTPDEVVQAAEDAGFGEPTLRILRQNAIDAQDSVALAELHRMSTTARLAADAARVAAAWLTGDDYYVDDDLTLREGKAVAAGAAQLATEAFAIADGLGNVEMAGRLYELMELMADEEAMAEVVQSSYHTIDRRSLWINSIIEIGDTLRTLAE